MKERILIAALSLALLLSGCGGGMKSEAVMSPSAAPMAPSVTESAGSNGMGMGYDGMYWDEAEMDMPAEEPYAPEEGTPSGQKLIRRANLSLETTEFEQAAGDLEELVAKFGGYISDSSVGNRGSGHRWANFTIRIPEKHFDQFLNQVGDLCFETWRSTSQEDISQQYYDTAGRLKTQQIKLERLQELLSKADVLITDYSNTMFEFALTGRPVFLYAPDYREYADSRGMYFEYESLPFPIATDVKELAENILSYDETVFINKQKEFFDKLKIIENGKASEKVARVILRVIGKE